MLDSESQRIIKRFSEKLKLLRDSVEKHFESIKEGNREETKSLLNQLDILDGIINEYSTSESESAQRRYVQAAVQSNELLSRLEAIVRDRDD